VGLKKSQKFCLIKIFYYICNIKVTNMRFTVRVHIGEGVIRNVFHTNDQHIAIETELELRKEYGDDNVWIADSLLELLVG